VQQFFSFGAAFLGSAVESTEALTIVLAVGLTRGWRAPLLGTVAALVALAVLVILFGQLIVTRIPDSALKLLVGTLLLLFVLRWPLARVPENTLKYAVGIVLTSLGTFWAAEGMGASWPLDFVSIGGLAVIYFVASRLAVQMIRRPALA